MGAHAVNPSLNYLDLLRDRGSRDSKAWEQVPDVGVIRQTSRGFKEALTAGAWQRVPSRQMGVEGERPFANSMRERGFADLSQDIPEARIPYERLDAGNRFWGLSGVPENEGTALRVITGFLSRSQTATGVYQDHFFDGQRIRNLSQLTPWTFWREMPRLG